MSDKRIKIITDTTANLPKQFASDHNIRVLPLTILLGTDMYKDQETLSTDELYNKVKANKIYPKTAATPPAEYAEIFKTYLDEGYEHIIFITISSLISSSMNNAIQASKILEAEDKITVLDSLNLCLGTGMQIMKLTEDIENNLPLEEIKENFIKRRNEILSIFAIETMEYLYKGGRCSALSYHIGKGLKMKPVIKLTDGKMGVDKLKLGKIEKALDYMVDQLKEFEKEGKTYTEIYITPSHAEKSKDYVYKKLVELGVPKNKIHVEEATGVIACHCGEGTLGIFTIKQPLNK